MVKAPAPPCELPTSDRTSITDDSAFASFRSPTSQRAKQPSRDVAGLKIDIPGRCLVQLLQHPAQLKNGWQTPSPLFLATRVIMFGVSQACVCQQVWMSTVGEMQGS